MNPLTKQAVEQCLLQVIDPETNLSIVAMGLVYDLKIVSEENNHEQVIITYTLTTPGCPLAGSFAYMIQKALQPLASSTFDPEKDIVLNLTFDPPWNLECMSAEARAELGFD
jgi:metal-sulfur cluster biosynthetic enzyme